MEVNNETDENLGLRNIQIIIETAEYIKPVFAATDISFEVKFRNELIGKSDNYLSFEEEEILVDFQINWQYDISTEESLADLISNPIQFIVWQSPGHHERAVSESDNAALPPPTDSVFSLYESNRLGINEPDLVAEEEVVPPKVTITEPKKEKSKKKERPKSNESARTSKGKVGKTASKASRSSNETSDKSEQSNISAPKDEPFVYGCSNLGLESLFSGDRQITQNLQLTQTSKRTDAEFGPLKDVPVLRVKVCLDKPFFDETRKLENILWFSVETMYNLPQNFTENMNYQLATVLPSELTGLHSVCLENGSYLDAASTSSKFKRWPNLYGKDVFCSTNESIQETTLDINNKINIDIADIFPCSAPRVEWKVLKSCWMNERSNEMWKKVLNRYRLWPIEIYMQPNVQVPDDTVVPVVKSGKMKTTGSKTSKGKTTVSKNSLQTREDLVGEPQHMMAFADITTLLYPGVTKTRVTCPLRTFQADEIKQETGLEKSFFAAKLAVEEVLPAEKTQTKGKQKGDSKSKDKTSTKSAKSKKDSSKRSDKRKKSEEVIIPEPIEIVEPTLEPSQPVLNAAGVPTFVILEFELMQPLRPRRTLEDLTNELTTIIPSRPPFPKTVLSTHFAVEHFRECICTLIRDINDKYQELPQLDELSTALFIRLLHKDGSYQAYMATLLKSVTMLISEKFKFDGETKNNKVYENFISNIYVHLVDEMNKELNGLTGCSIDTCKQGPQAVDFDYLYSSEEAVELQAPLLAERYILETLSKDTRNADVWLHYAVYQMGQGLQDQAFECLKESLALKVDHKYSLLLFAVILFDKEDYYLAETTFLSVVTNYSRFLDGWICLYLFYKARQNAEGCDVCCEMMTKCEPCEPDEEEYLGNRDGLAWTTSMCVPENRFMKTAMVLIKLRALKFAELALNCENSPESGASVYYQGVVQYFMGNYENALECLMLAQKLHGADYAVNSMIGHCNYHLGNFDEARDAYEFIVYAYNRPEDMHMLFTNLAMIYEKENNLEMARMLLLIVCKLSPTAFSWLLLGAVLYKENNMLSAEQCLNESNILDNRLPETWAYLTLVNLKNGNNWEAEQCCIEMRKHNLKNESLLATVEEEMIRHKQSP